MRNSKKGFTIIEMVIVIAIIGILATVLIPTYGNVVASANESAAQQTARSVMTNWLASSTSAGGVPTSGPDGNGNTLYAAYFEIKGGNGTTYQYRYTSGGVERTDNDSSKYEDFSKLDVIENAYLTTPLTDSAFDANSYAVSVYDKVKTATTAANGIAANATYHTYYIKYPSGSTSETSELKYVYDFGGADVYAATNGAQVIYTVANYTTAGVVEWKETAEGDVIGVDKDGSTLCTFKKQTCSGLTFTKASTISVTNTTNTVKVGATLTLTANNTGASTLTWTSSNDAIATVDASGVVTGKAAGAVTITVSNGTDSATYNITVTAD